MEPVAATIVPTAERERPDLYVGVYITHGPRADYASTPSAFVSTDETRNAHPDCDVFARIPGTAALRDIEARTRKCWLVDWKNGAWTLCTEEPHPSRTGDYTVRSGIFIADPASVEGGK